MPAFSSWMVWSLKTFEVPEGPLRSTSTEIPSTIAVLGIAKPRPVAVIVALFAFVATEAVA